MTAVSSHIELTVPTGEATRDRLRTELAEYVCGTIMLDGVSRDTHQTLVTNNGYSIDPRIDVGRIAQATQEEVLF